MSVTQRSDLGRVLNMSWVLNVPGFRIWQGSEYARVTKGSKYSTIWLNTSEFMIIDRALNIYHTICSGSLM